MTISVTILQSPVKMNCSEGRNCGRSFATLPLYRVISRGVLFGVIVLRNLGRDMGNCDDECHDFAIALQF